MCFKSCSVNGVEVLCLQTNHLIMYTLEASTPTTAMLYLDFQSYKLQGWLWQSSCPSHEQITHFLCQTWWVWSYILDHVCTFASIWFSQFSVILCAAQNLPEAPHQPMSWIWKPCLGRQTYLCQANFVAIVMVALQPQVFFLGWGKRCDNLTTSWAWPHQNWWSRSWAIQTPNEDQ